MADKENQDDASRTISDSFKNQIEVLRTLSTESAAAEETRHYQISEISERAGLNDEKETQRYLFILEGQKLVSPYPAGDFTSKVWQITSDGKRALKTMEKSGYRQ